MADTARALLTEALEPLAAPDAARPVILESYLRAPDNLAKRMVLISIEAVSPSPSALGTRLYTAQLVVAVPTTKTGAADDDLDQLLDDVLDLLDNAVPSPSVSWTRATRGTYKDGKSPAYLVDVTVEAEITTT